MHLPQSVETAESSVVSLCKKPKSYYCLTIHCFTRIQTSPGVCGCKRAGGKPCSALFPREHYEEYRQQCGTPRDELDFVLLCQIMALLSNDAETGARSKKAPTTRQRSAMIFHHGGWRMWQNLPEAAWNWYDSHYKYMYM